MDGFCAGAAGVPVAGAPDAGIDGACAHVAGSDISPPRQKSVTIAAHRVVLVILRVIAVLHLLSHDRPVGASTQSSRAPSSG
jgi:hypothetical protein